MIFNFALFVIFFAQSNLALPPQLRIYGGEIASPGQFPFAAGLFNPDQTCDASIISKNWLVTAAHCIDVIDANTTIRVGSIFSHSGGTVLTVSKALKHENYSDETLINDIGLIKIVGEIVFDEATQPAEIANPAENSTCYAVGWGASEDDYFPEELRFVELTALGVESCKSMIGDTDVFYLGEGQVCALGDEGKGACFGDSGGPLVCDGKLAGIVSYTVSACAHGLPDVYTRASFYTDWIQSIIS